MNANEIYKNLGKGVLVLIALYLVIKVFNYQTKMVEHFSLNTDELKSKMQEEDQKQKVKSSVSTESSSSNSSKSTDNSSTDTTQTAIEYYKSILSIDDSDAQKVMTSSIEENEQLISLMVYMGSFWSMAILVDAYKDPFTTTTQMDELYDLIDKTNKLNQFRETLKSLPDISKNAASSSKKSSWW